MSIPASSIVTINPSVLAAGGNALSLNGLILTQDHAVPIGSVYNFTTASDVGDFFGTSSNEYAWASLYFQGRNNATSYPASLLMAQYPEVAVAAYLRGASLGTMSLTTLQGFTGTITLTVNGTAEASASINLSAATSFSNAATIIQAGFTLPNFTVSYDSIRKAFVFTSSTTGAASTITVATGTLATDLLLTSATGAVTSQGADAAVAATFMNALLNVNQNWASFSTVWSASSADKIAFAAWNSSKNNRYEYVLWETAVAAKIYPDTTTALATILADGYSGIFPIYCDASLDPNGLAAAFVMGLTASIDFNRANGRTDYKFKYLAGVPVSVTDSTTSGALTQNKYNYVGQWATANDSFTFLAEGSVTGIFDWADSYADQIFLNSQLQLALMTLLSNSNSVPYNPAGNTLITQACQDPINQGLLNGSIVPGVTLSAAQIAAVNGAAGQAIDQTLSNRGWYLQVGTPTAQVRAARGTPPINFWYMDGGSVHQITVASIMVQ